MKRKLTQAQYDALDPILQAEYKQNGDDWLLGLEGDSLLERSLAAERRNHSQTSRMLADLVPEILDATASTGYVERRRWRALVTDRAGLLDELGDDFDMETFRAFKDRDPEDDPKPVDETELQVQIREAQVENRRLTRENTRLGREGTATTERVAELEASNNDLVMERDLNRTFDEINVRDPRRRRIAKAVFRQDMGMEVVDGEVMVTVDGAQVPLVEYGPDWAGTEDGKEFVSAADNSGGGDGGKPTGGSISASDRQKMTPGQKIAAAFAEKSS